MIMLHFVIPQNLVTVRTDTGQILDDHSLVLSCSSCDLRDLIASIKSEQMREISGGETNISTTTNACSISMLWFTFTYKYNQAL